MTETVGIEDDRLFAASVAALRKSQGSTRAELADRMVALGSTRMPPDNDRRMGKGDQAVRLGEARALASILNSFDSRLSVMPTISSE